MKLPCEDRPLIHPLYRDLLSKLTEQPILDLDRPERFIQKPPVIERLPGQHDWGHAYHNPRYSKV